MKPVHYLRIKEVAALLNISVKTVYKKLGFIPGYINLDGMHLFDEEELLRGLKELATQKKTAVKFHQTRDKHGLMN